MKKTALVIVMALALVFAFTAVALADTSSGYITWDANAGDNDLFAATPHYGYSQTTEKCIVCHAAHKATSTGEVLLGATVANSCVFCHIQGGAAGAVQVYASTPANFTTASVFAHNNACSQCHAVHGANVIEADNLELKILKNGTAQASPALPVAWNKAAAGTDRAGAVSAFCTQCHPYYTGTYAVAGTTGDITVSAVAYNSHIMTSDYTAYGPANGGNNAATYNGQVAWAATTYCTNCHDAGADTVANNFPHYTDGARFMKSAANVEGIAAATGAASPTQDGVCLKCHVTGTTAGAGITF